MKKMFNKGRLALAVLVGAVAAPAAFAGGGGGMDYSALTDAISFDDVGPAVMTAAGALVALYVIILGVRLIMRFAKSG